MNNKEFYLKWSFNNSKVSKLNAVSFGLPAYQSSDGFLVCPQANSCKAICYARQGHYLLSNVAAAREYNLAIIRNNITDFETKATEDLVKITNKIVRIHDSGDFYSQEYYDAWNRIARHFPNKIFYAYTKSLHLNLWHNKAKNLKITQSEGGLLDDKIDKKKPHARIFSTNYLRRKAKYGDGHMTDTLAIRGAQKIGLVYHGNKKLTPAQKVYFS